MGSTSLFILAGDGFQANEAFGPKGVFEHYTVSAISALGVKSNPTAGIWLDASTSPTVAFDSVTTSTGSVTPSWSVESGSSQVVAQNGFIDATAQAPSGETYTCRTQGASCSIMGLNPTTPYLVSVSAETLSGAGIPTFFDGLIYPVTASKLTVKAIPIAFSKSLTALAYGVAPGTVVKIGIPGQNTTCTANDAGQCTASLKTSKTGSWTILAKAGSQTATASAWYPALKVTAGVHHGKPFTVNITHAPPKAPVVLTLSDGRTIKATTSTAGGVVVSVKTTKADFLTVNVSISGTAFGPYDVQVS